MVDYAIHYKQKFYSKSAKLKSDHDQQLTNLITVFNSIEIEVQICEVPYLNINLQ